ncbi:MAG TPA: AIR synthase-related protein [Prolixibacteraceae bacterium]|nr:AIR synthase-related protein [Prolixibacteraceae bacterium]
MEQVNPSEKFDINQIPEPENISEVIDQLMVNPNLTPLNYFNDFTEFAATSKELSGVDIDESGIFDLDDGLKYMSMTIHAMHHHLENNPQKAAEILVSRAARKMVCQGGIPRAITALLYHINLGDPNGQYIATGIKQGLENAASVYGLTISDKKIRFDYFGEHGSQAPTLIVNLAGTLPGTELLRSKPMSQSFKKKGNMIYLIGKVSEDIATSDYLEFYHGIADSPLPAFDLEFEARLLQVVSSLIEKKLVESAGPVAKGGIFFSLLRACWLNGLGFDITTAAETRTDAFLFGESMGRIIVGVSPEKEDDFVDFMYDSKVPFFTLGHVTKGEIRIDDQSFGFIDKMTESL